MPAVQSDPLCALGVIDPRWTGVTYARFHLPFSRLAERGISLRTLDQGLRLVEGPDGLQPEASLLDGADLLVFPQAIAAPALPGGRPLLLAEPLCALARERGIPVIHSIDDYLPELESHRPAYETLREAAPNLAALLREADAFIVTTAALQESLRGRGKPVHLLPNTIDLERWQRRPGGAHTVPRVGWCGSSSHLDDLLMVLPAIRLLQRRRPFLFVLHGLCEGTLEDETRNIERGRAGFSRSQRETAERFVALTGMLAEIEHLHLPFVPMESYFKTLPALDLDIGICPLLDNPFNRHKSALKFYEYAAVGTMTVASDVPPYRGEVSVTCENDEAAWSDTLERHLVDEALREGLAAEQRRFVARERDVGRWTGAWEKALREVGRMRCVPTSDR